MGWTSAALAKVDRIEAEGGCPTMEHTPITTAVRGVPAVIPVNISCPQGGTLAEVNIFVRLYEAGKPVEVDVQNRGDGLHQATVAATLIEGVNRFWYYIEAIGIGPDGERRVVQTRWYPVNVVQGAGNKGGAGGAAGGGGGGGGSGGASLRNAALWVGAGLGAVGAGIWIENENDDGSGGGGGGTQTNAPPPPPRNDSEDEEEDEEDENPVLPPVNPPPPPPCFTGNESASVDEGTACDTNSTIFVSVCGTCDGAEIEVSASWGPSYTATASFDGEACTGEFFDLPQPPGVPSVSVGQFTITILVNGQVIDTVPWPGPTYFDCF